MRVIIACGAGAGAGDGVLALALALDSVTEVLERASAMLRVYPKDNTPGCTLEGQDFRDNHKEFTKLNAEILGVSRDSIKSHENFKEKQSFPFQLLSDPDEAMCKSFDVMREKSMYGKKYIGVDRSTFLINSNGLVEKEWRSVKVKGHVLEVLQALKEI